MPYIAQDERNKYDVLLRNLPIIETKGQLEYCIFVLMKNFMSNKPHRYSTLHDCTYAAIHCGDEFRRRFLDEREDEARLNNGDIL